MILIYRKSRRAQAEIAAMLERVADELAKIEERLPWPRQTDEQIQHTILDGLSAGPASVEVNEDIIKEVLSGDNE